MKPLGRGRIVLWEGASLWAFDVPSAPTARHSTEAHAHHALQLTFAVQGEFAFRIGAETIEGPAVLIAPDVSHVYVAEGRNVILFVEPESKLGTALLRDLAGRPYMRLNPEKLADRATSLIGIWEEPRPDDATLAGIGQAVAARIADSASRAPVLHLRISRVLERLRDDPDLRMNASTAASIACLSESRFSHLFVEQVGLQFRTYLLWRRLSVAVEQMAAGASLTSAAHHAGFAELCALQPHLPQDVRDTGLSAADDLVRCPDLQSALRPLFVSSTVSFKRDPRMGRRSRTPDIGVGECGPHAPFHATSSADQGTQMRPIPGARQLLQC